LVVVDDYSQYTWVFFLHSKDEASEDVGKLKAKGDIGVFAGYLKGSAAFEIYNKRTRKIHESVKVNFDEILEMASIQFSLKPGLSKLNETGKSLNPSVSQASETSKKDLEDLFQNFYDDYFDSSKIMKSSPTNIETSNVEVPSHEEEDAYFDASTSFHDPSNVHTFFQPYPHEKKWTKDHPLHKIIGDPKSSVRTRGHLANSRLFSCLLSSIEPANVAKALIDADWVSAMEEELDQFARLKEEVYVDQPPGFVSKQYPDHVYALDKALYGLKQAPRAWYDVLLQFLIDSGFQKDHTDYRSMIGSLMYVTSSRLDIMFATCKCARYQENPNEHHVSVVKRIFRYLKGTINLGHWYPKDSGFDLTAYSDADHAGCHLDRKSTSGSVQFLGDKLVCWSSKKQNCVFISTAESEYVAVSS
nr:hypothetical protein [Tanacetum cinerariifolium]